MPERPFNSPVETGLRALFVLLAVYPKSLNIQRLIFYDYLALHSEDAGSGPASLHPAIPHRGSQWLVRREALRTGLALAANRELVTVDATDSGFSYSATPITEVFLKALTSDYARELLNRAKWVVSNFGPYSDEELTRFMSDNIGRWGAEFKYESLVRGTPYEL